MEDKIKLVYFKFHGRVEAIRMLLAHAKVEYEDYYVTLEEWMQGDIKKELILGQMPMFKIDGKTLFQSMSILRYIGRKYGYYPEDIYEAYKVDMIVDSITDYFMGILPYINAKDNKSKNDAVRNFVGDHTKKFLKFYDGLYTENGSTGYMVGSSWTIADFVVLTITHTALTHDFYKHLYGDVINDYPALKQFTEDRVVDIKDHLDTRENFPMTFVVQSKLEYLPEDE